MSDLITSAANPAVKRVRALADRKHRRREHAYVVEGLQPVWRAVTAGVPVELIMIAPDLLGNPAALAMVAEQENAGVPVARVNADIFTRLSERDGPAGLLAILSGGIGTLNDLVITDDSVFVVLHQLSTPGNIGTIIRTVDAAGAQAVILLGNSADPLSPAAVKASMGSLFAVPVVAVATEAELLEWASDLHVAALTGAGATDLWQAELPRPLLLMFGNEGAGLTDSLIEAADSRIRIAMDGTAESLNVAAAAAITLYELKRRG